MISATEIMAVQDGISNDIREDGRTLLQRRPVEVTCTHSGSGGLRGADAETGEDGAVAQVDQYAGSRVEVRMTDTVVLAASTPSVVEIAAEGELDSASADATSPRDDPRCRGQLFISIDAAPHVVDYYARVMGGRSSRYRRSFLAYLAHNIRSVFGAEGVSAQEQLGGVVEAELVSDDEGAGGDDSDEVDANGAAARPLEASSGLATGFPAKDLYIGKHFAFRIDVDVHVLEAGGGNPLTTVALAVYAALASCQLPSVVLHQATTGSGTSVEVDKSKPYTHEVDWSSLPMLCVLHMSPTGHYLVDATPREALALPQQLHVAATNRGTLCYSRYQQWPSRKGGRLVVRDEVGKPGGSSQPAIGLGAETKRPREDGGTEATVLESAASPSSAALQEKERLEPMEVVLLHNRNVAVPPAELSLGDFLAAVNDAVHVCQAMIADCHITIDHHTES